MKKLIVLLFLISFTLLFCQSIVIDSLSCANGLEGHILMNHSGNVVYFTTMDTNAFTVGDVWSSIFSIECVVLTYLSFSVPSNITPLNFVDAHLNLRVGNAWCDGIPYVYPVFQLPTGNVTPECYVSHIDYGLSLDANDAFLPNLHPPVSFINVNNHYVGWYSINISSFVSNDLLNNRPFTQYKLTLQHGQTFSDWDYCNDYIAVSSSGYSSLQQNPYIIIRYIVPPVVPTIEHTPFTTISNDMMPVNFACSVTDDTALNSVLLKYRIDDQDSVTVVMNSSDSTNYNCSVDTNLPNEGGHFYYKISATDIDNHTTYLPDAGWFDAIIEPTALNDETYTASLIKITSVYPNPFHLGTGKEIKTEFVANPNTRIETCIYNLKGQLIRNLGYCTSSGKNNFISWNGRDDLNQIVRPGMYFIRIKQDNINDVKKVIILN